MEEGRFKRLQDRIDEALSGAHRFEDPDSEDAAPEAVSVCTYPACFYIANNPFALRKHIEEHARAAQVILRPLRDGEQGADGPPKSGDLERELKQELERLVFKRASWERERAALLRAHRSMVDEVAHVRKGAQQDMDRMAEENARLRQQLTLAPSASVVEENARLRTDVEKWRRATTAVRMQLQGRLEQAQRQIADLERRPCNCASYDTKATQEL